MERFVSSYCHLMFHDDIVLFKKPQQYSVSEKDLEELDVLGTGSCGHVAKMRHKQTGNLIAVKQMRRSGNEEETKKISTDLEVLLKCSNCDHIVQCYGYIIKDADVWICMELMASCFDKILKRMEDSLPEDILGKVAVAVSTPFVSFIFKSFQVMWIKL